MAERGVAVRGAPAPQRTAANLRAEIEILGAQVRSQEFAIGAMRARLARRNGDGAAVDLAEPLRRLSDDAGVTDAAGRPSLTADHGRYGPAAAGLPPPSASWWPQAAPPARTLGQALAAGQEGRPGVDAKTVGFDATGLDEAALASALATVRTVRQRSPGVVPVFLVDRWRMQRRSATARSSSICRLSTTRRPRGQPMPHAVH